MSELSYEPRRSSRRAGRAQIDTGAAVQVIGQLPDQVDLSVYQGDDYFIDISVDDGITPIDLTLYTVESQIRLKPGDATVIATFTATVLDAHTVRLHLPSAESTKVPATAAWDVQIVDSAGLVTTLLYGSVNTAREVTT